MDWKSALLKNITRLPNSLNLVLMNANSNPNYVYGKRYKRYREDLKKGIDPIAAERILLASVNYALANIKYYHKLYGAREVCSLSEFEQRIGFINKDIIMANFQEFINSGIDLSRYDQGTTGGTSGKPLRLIAPRDRYAVEMATMHSLWERVGCHFDVRGVIRNRRLARRDFLVNPISREVIFDGFRLDDDYFANIYQVLRRFGIRFVHCYPSTAYEFSLFLSQNHLETSFIKAFLSGSENIFDYQVDLIQNRLGIRFYYWYGHSEKLVLAGCCEKTNDYHVEPSYGHFELIDNEGLVVREPGRTGEIVGTSFHNPGMPLVRYRTGDFAEYVGDHCQACGRRMPIMRNVRGRWSGDRVYNSDGTFITTTALNLHNDLFAVIDGLQYIQQKKGELTVLVVKSPNYTVLHEQALYRHFREKLKPDARIVICYVDRLRRLPNGKFALLISAVRP